MGGPPKRLKQHLRLQKLGFAPDKLGMILMARGIASSVAGRGANRHQSLGRWNLRGCCMLSTRRSGLYPDGPARTPCPSLPTGVAVCSISL